MLKIHINMANSSVIQLYSLSAKSISTYIVAVVFIVGNILLPQLCHQIPNGGNIFLPIYFFTIIAAYKYGPVTGLTTAFASPIVNSLIFSMPAAAMLPAILCKSIFAALASSIIAARYHSVSLLMIAAVVFIYQFFGTLTEWYICGDFMQAILDLKMGIPGIILQIVGGYLLIKKI